MNINQLTIAEVKEILALFPQFAPTTPVSEQQGTAPFTIGDNYFIRTVTHHLTGELVAVYPTELVITKAAWIADDGRFAEALANSKFSEVEPFPATNLVIVGRGSIIDATQISTLPLSQK
jgi:hypothetical protein